MNKEVLEDHKIIKQDKKGIFFEDEGYIVRDYIFKKFNQKEKMSNQILSITIHILLIMSINIAYIFIMLFVGDFEKIMITMILLNTVLLLSTRKRCKQSIK